MDLVVRMVEHHVWLVGEMIARARRLDDDVLDAAIEVSVDGAPTLRSLLARLDESFVDVQGDPPRVSTCGGMIAHVLTFAAQRRTRVAGALTAAGVADLGDGDPLPWMSEPS